MLRTVLARNHFMALCCLMQGLTFRHSQTFYECLLSAQKCAWDKMTINIFFYPFYLLILRKAFPLCKCGILKICVPFKRPFTYQFISIVFPPKSV